MSGRLHGHEPIRTKLEKFLPPVSLFLGPNSVGKWRLAEWARDLWGISASDVFRVRRLTQENARAVVDFSSSQANGDSRLAIIKLDGKATRAAQNTILKALEDATSTKFILISEEPPLPTIVSRSEIFHFGLLTDSDIASILQDRNMSLQDSMTLAPSGKGQVSRALEQASNQDDKLVVLQVVEALNRKDRFSLETMATFWREEHTELLIQWCYESITRKWRLFSASDVQVTGTRIPLRVLSVLKEDLRPRLVIRAALVSVIQE